MLPFGLLLVMCAAVVCGQAAPLPLVAALGSFLVQTHIGYLPAVVTAVGVSIALSFLRRRTDGRGGDFPKRAIAVAAATLAAMWVLPLAEQLTRAPGNLSLIARYFSTQGVQHGLGDSLAIVAREIAWPCSFASSGARRHYEAYPDSGGAQLAVAAAFAVAQTALLSIWSIRLRGRPFARALAGVCLASTVTAPLAVMRVSGEVRPYITTWISMVGALGTFAAVAPLLKPWILDRPPTRWAAALALVAGLALAAALVGRPVVRDSEVAGANSVSDAVVEELRRLGSQRAQVTIQTRSPELFYVASAVLLQMHKRGVAFTVDRPWWNFFGERWRPTGTEDVALDFHAGRRTTGPPPLVCSGTGAAPLCITMSSSAPPRPEGRP